LFANESCLDAAIPNLELESSRLGDLSRQPSTNKPRTPALQRTHDLLSKSGASVNEFAPRHSSIREKFVDGLRNLAKSPLSAIARILDLELLVLMAKRLI